MAFPTKIKLSAVDKASSVFKRVGKSANALGNQFRKVNNQFTRFQDKTKKLRKSLDKVGTGMKNVGQKASLGLTAPIGLFGKAAFDATLSFDKAMNNVEAKAKFTGKSIEDLRAQAKELGSTTSFSASEAAQAMGFLAQAGFDSQSIFESMPGVLNLAAASNTEIARTADVASNIMGAFGLKATEMTRVADVLASTMAGSNVDMDQLADTMKFAAPVADKFGLSLEETAAAAGLLGNIGIQGTSAGTALKNAFLGLSAPTSGARTMIEGLGVQVADENGKLRNFTAIMSDLGKELGDIPQAAQLEVLNQLFGKIGIAGASELVKQAKSGELAKFTQDLMNAEGAADKMAKTLQKGAVGSVTRFKSAMEGMMIAIGESGLVDAIASIADKMSSVFASISKTNPGLLKIGVIIAGLAAAIGPVLVVLGSMVTMFASVVSMAGGLSALGTLIAGLTAPVLAVVAAVLSLGYAAYQVMKHWGAVKFGFMSMWNAIKDMFEDGVDHILSMLDNLIGYLPNVVKNKLGVGDAVFEVKTKAQKEAERSKRDMDLLNQIDSEEAAREQNVKPGLGADMNAKVKEMFAKSKDAVKGVQNTYTEIKESTLKVEFKNAPPGMKVDTTKVKDNAVQIKTGYQGATI